MGCIASKPSHVGNYNGPPRPASDISHHSADHPPTPPPKPLTRRKRKTPGDNDYIESPHRKWQRRQLGSLFPAVDGTASWRPSVPHMPSSLHVRKQHLHDSSSAEKELPYPPGTAVPYKPQPQPQLSAPPTPEAPSSSSVYSPNDGCQVTPVPYSFARQNSYRSYSGKLMYSPARFPADSSPMGTPTIRTVPRSTADLLGAGVGGEEAMNGGGGRSGTEKLEDGNER